MKWRRHDGVSSATVAETGHGKRASSWWRVEASDVPARARWSDSLQRVHAYGMLAIALGLIALCVWSSVIARHGALTYDFAFYAQGWYLIAHGHLNPYSTIVQEPLWRNAGEFVLWPLAPLWYLWPHPLTLLWVQDGATAACEAVVFFWMCQIAALARARNQIGPWFTALLPAMGLIVMIATPWTIWIDSFDFHPQPIDLLASIIAAHAFWRGRSRVGWIAAVLSAACGAIGATYVAGVGISALLAGRRWRRVGVSLVALGIGWLLVLSLLGADHASVVYHALVNHRGGPVGAANLAGALLLHPGRAVSAVWSVHTDVFADVASGGLIGALSPWALGTTLLVLIEGALTGSAGYISPHVQNTLPVLLLVPLGTVAICVAVASSSLRWRRILAATLALAAVLNTVGWLLTWAPRTAATWDSVSAATGQTLAKARALMSPSDEVVVSQGVVGTFALRRYVYPLTANPPLRLPVKSRTVWFVLAPTSGIESQSPVAAQSEVTQLVQRIGAAMILDENGVYVLRWRPPTRYRSVELRATTLLAAYAIEPSSPDLITRGSPATWHYVSRQSGGELLSGDYWPEPLGTLVTSLRVSSHGPLTVQWWDTTANTEIAAQRLPSSDGRVVTRTLRIRFTHAVVPTAYSGRWPFVILALAPPALNDVEVRVYKLGGAPAALYDVSMHSSSARGG